MKIKGGELSVLKIITMTNNHNFHFSFEEAQIHMETIKHLRHLSAFKSQKQESLSNRK